MWENNREMWGKVCLPEREVGDLPPGVEVCYASWEPWRAAGKVGYPGCQPCLLHPGPPHHSLHNTQPRSPQTSICSPILQPPVKFHQLSTLQKGGVLLVRHSFHGGGHLACSPSSFVLLHDRPPFPYRGLSRVLKKHFRSGQHHCPNSI